MGVAEHLAATIGQIQQSTGFILILITIVVTRRLPKIGTFFNMFFIGFFVDHIFRWGVLSTPNSVWTSYAYLITGILLLGLGSGIYLSAALGAGPRDGLMLYLANRFDIRIRIVRTVMEVAAVSVGFLMGGPVGRGTVIVSMTIGFVVEISFRYFRNKLNFVESFEPSSQIKSMNRNLKKATG